MLHTHAEVNTLQRLAGDIGDLTLQEGVEGVLSCDTAASGSACIVDIHACCQHGHGQTSALFHTHGAELVLDIHIVGRIERELQAEVLQCLGDFHADLEVDASRLLVLGDGGAHLFRSGNVQFRIHQRA